MRARRVWKTVSPSTRPEVRALTYVPRLSYCSSLSLSFKLMPPPLDLAELVAQVAQEKRLKKEEHELKEHEQRQTTISIPPLQTPPPSIYTEPESLPTTSTTSTPRPKNRRSRASFDWFGDSPRPATSPQKGGPLTTSGLEETDEGPEAGVFKGAFTNADLERGARRMSASQGERPRAASLEPVGGKRRASSVGRRGGKQVAREGMDEWEDELRDTMGEVGGPSGVSASVRKMSLWGAASRKSGRGASGSTTPEEEGEEGGQGRDRKSVV